MPNTQLTQQEQQTLETYEQHGKGWVDAHMSIDSYQKEFNTFQEYLPEGKILEIGSGGGRDAARFIDAGYEYTGIDISKTLLDIAKKKNPTGTFLHKSAYEIDFPAKSFDGFWTCATLLHIPKEKIHGVLQSIHSVIKKGGIGFISLKKGTGEQMISDSWTDNTTERFFSFYQKKEFDEILKDSNFEIVHFYEMTNKKGVEWLIYFVRKI